MTLNLPSIVDLSSKLSSEIARNGAYLDVKISKFSAGACPHASLAKSRFGEVLGLDRV